MPRPRSCRPPRTVTVKGHWRQVRKTRKKPRAYKPLPWVVRNSRTGRIVSQHRTWSAAVRARKRLDLASYRRGEGRPYDTEKR